MGFQDQISEPVIVGHMKSPDNNSLQQALQKLQHDFLWVHSMCDITATGVYISVHVVHLCTQSNNDYVISSWWCAGGARRAARKAAGSTAGPAVNKQPPPAMRFMWNPARDYKANNPK